MRLLAVLALFALASCAGNMTGVVRGTGDPVQISYEQGLSSDTYTAVIGAETFRGKAVMDGTQSISGIASVGSDMASILGATTTNKFVALMIGDKGNTLSCNLTYASSEGFTGLGGVGMCRHTDGRVIDIVW